MPPFRTSIDLSAKPPVKSERTHEENQERAYIAASRRSDRSLEARVESARRASEIHKRRTGRSLRVTEQDVINEEMYEEEDDDLPMQYRRLTAHLQTSNADFDRRLAAYLTNHVAMRTALGQAVSDSYGQRQNQNQQFYANAPSFTNPSLLGQSPSISTPSSGQQQNGQSTNSQSPYPFSPYPLATQQAFQAAMSGRSASVANHLSSLGPNGPQIGRRTSMPVQNKSSTNLADNKLEAASQRSSSISPTNQPQQQQPSTFPSAFIGLGDLGAGSLAPNGPLSTTLPLESQQLLSGALDPNDPMTSMLMGGSQQPFYSYNPNGDPKHSFTSSMPNRALGINQTLSPGFMDGFSSNSSGAHDNERPASTARYDSAIAFDGSSSYDDFLKPSGLSNSSTPEGTPAFEQDWQNFFDGNLWEEKQPSSQPPVTV